MTIENHLYISDQEFENQFRECVLSPQLFNHEAHLRLAWIHIKKYGIDQAIHNVSTQLQVYVDHLQAKDKYNETLTIAAVKIVHHFILKSKADNFMDFINEHTRLRTNFNELLRQHYKTNIFTSAQAKEKYLEPELLPFD